MLPDETAAFLDRVAVSVLARAVNDYLLELQGRWPPPHNHNLWMPEFLECPSTFFQTEDYLFWCQVVGLEPEWIKAKLLKAGKLCPK